jgi:hypothetical protein
LDDWEVQVGRRGKKVGERPRKK